MKKIVSAVVIGLLMVCCYAAGWWGNVHKPTTTSDEDRVLYWVDPMHPDYKSDRPGIAPDCGMQLKPVYAKGLISAQLSAESVSVNAATMQLLGISTATAERSGAPRMIRVPGRVVAEDTRIYRIDSGTDGFIRETFNDSVGSFVKKNQKLATCYGPEFLSIASGFLAATAGSAVGKDGSRTVPFPGALSKQGVSSLEGYADRLRNLGMSDFQINEMEQKRQLPESIYVVSPVDGFIVARNVTPGQHFARSSEFYRIADLGRVWIVADLLDGEGKNIQVGTSARVTLSSGSKDFTAHVSSVLPEVDPATRTLELRLEADNSSLALRPDMFVNVEVPISMPSALTIPANAVIDSGSEQLVYVERAKGVFEPRQVKTGWRFGERIQILRGLTEGDRVVAEGTFLIDSESRLKSVARIAGQPPRDNMRARSEGGADIAASRSKNLAPVATSGIPR